MSSQRTKKVLTAQAEAEKIRMVGEAEAKSIEAVGKAEAERMRLKADAYQQYGVAAKTALVLEALPKVQKPIWKCVRILLRSVRKTHLNLKLGVGC